MFFLIFIFLFHSLLGYRRAVPTTGRTLNVVTQIMRICPPKLKATFYKSPEPDENICLTGNCDQYCDHHHPICSKDDQLEVCLLFSKFVFVHCNVTDAMHSLFRVPLWLIYQMMRRQIDMYVFLNYIPKSN